jgi:hypothetical protein
MKSYNLKNIEDREIYEALIQPTTNIIQNVGVSSAEIFVESVKTFFDNGGAQAYIAREVNTDAVKASVSFRDSNSSIVQAVSFSLDGTTNQPAKKKQPVVVFAVPGHHFTPGFVSSWTNFTTINSMNQKIHLTYTNTYSPNLYHCRNLLLGGDNLAGIFQTPWQGKLQYDYIFFIDTDQVFDPDQVYSLIDRVY